MIKNNTAKVLKVEYFTERVYEITLERNDLPFKVGMALSIVGPDGKTVRSFSLSSGLHEDEFRMLIKEIPGGKLSPWLGQMKPGDEVQFRGPFGPFRPGDHGGDPFCYIATGTGITPLLSHFHSHPDRPPARLLYGVRHVREAVFFDTLSGWCPTTLCVSGEDPPEGHHRGRVTDILDTLPLEAPMYYDLCGLDDMIFDVRDWLMERGVEKDRIHHEVFFRAPRKLPPLPPKKPPTHGA